MSQQTLAMFYWAVANITRKESRVYKPIVKQLLTEENITLQTAGAIVHARKYYENRNLNPEYC